ncbi:class I SAM-dependent methyltransferase [Cryobacterium lyxosi]|uniref:class I SAM-dependent methyltransferase n=1 Tax=Cryobacterium lyxosi TaxID=1259228 RepID=UPI003B971AEE
MAHAANAFPTADFVIEGLESIDAGTNSVGGVLSWHSLIHYEPGAIQVPLREFSRVIKPGGTLLAISAELGRAGFDVLESHVRKTAGQRPQAAVSARRQDAR